MKKAATIGIFCLLLTGVNVTRLSSQVNVTTWHNDIGRTGQNTQETVLTPGDVDQHQNGTVTTETFGLLCRFTSTSVTGQIYAQPLVVSNMDGSMTVYVATMYDYVYAFQIPHNWNGVCSGITTSSVNLLPSNSGENPADCCYIGSGHNGVACSQGQNKTPFYPTAGVLGTPVIDTASNTLYVLAEAQQGPTSNYNPGVCDNSDHRPSAWYHRLHALDLTTLHEKYGGPVMIPSSTVGQTTFVSQKEIQRPALLWLNGSQTISGKPSVYIGFSMMDGTQPHPSGWVFGYNGDLTNSTSPMVYATTAGYTDVTQGTGGGIWQGGAGLAAGQEQSGNPYYIYFSTGDGGFDLDSQTPPNTDAGDSFLKLTTDLATVSDYFTPADQYYRWNKQCKEQYGEDVDFGSTGVTVFPNGVPSASSYLVVKSDKENYLWVMNRTNLRQFNGSSCNGNCTPGCGLTLNNTVETPFLLSTTLCNGNPCQARSTAAFWNGSAPNSGDAGEMYFAGQYDQLKRYPVNNTCPVGQGYPPICFKAVATNVDPNSTQPGLGYASTPSVSSGPSPTYSNGIVWATKTADTNPGLFGFDAVTLNELYTSNSCFTNDAIAPGKFAVPTIANGYVFVGTLTDFDIFGVVPARSCN